MRSIFTLCIFALAIFSVGLYIVEPSAYRVQTHVADARQVADTFLQWQPGPKTYIHYFNGDGKNVRHIYEVESSGSETKSRFTERYGCLRYRTYPANLQVRKHVASTTPLYEMWSSDGTGYFFLEGFGLHHPECERMVLAKRAWPTGPTVGTGYSLSSVEQRKSAVLADPTRGVPVGVSQAALAEIKLRYPYSLIIRKGIVGYLEMPKIGARNDQCIEWDHLFDRFVEWSNAAWGHYGDWSVVMDLRKETQQEWLILYYALKPKGTCS